MIEEQARVVAIDADGVWVETQRRSTCGQCAANKGCGTAVIGKIVGRKHNRVRVLNNHTKRVTVGDEVIIGIAEQALLRGSMAVYVVPLFSLFLSALLGQTLGVQLGWHTTEIPTISFAIVGLLLGFAWVRRFTRTAQNDPQFQPIIINTVGKIIPLPAPHSTP